MCFADFSHCAFCLPWAIGTILTLKCFRTCKPESGAMDHSGDMEVFRLTSV